MTDYPVHNYEEALERKKVRAFYDVLAEAVLKVHGPSMIISTSVDGDNIHLQNTQGRGSLREDLEKCVSIPKNDLLPHIIAYLIKSSNSEDYYRNVVVNNSFSCPAGQMINVVRAICEVADYNKTHFRVLPFYAKAILQANPRFN